MAKRKSTHGGKRAGAGRPSKGLDRMVPFTITLTQRDLDRLGPERVKEVARRAIKRAKAE